MEVFVRSLHARLEEKPVEMRMFETFIDRALEEMQNAGYFSNLDPALQAKVDSEDQEESLEIKTALAKEMAHHSFIKASHSIDLKDGRTARHIQVKVDPAFLNCLTLSIQGSLEGLYLTGAHKKNADERMYYLIQSDATGEVWDALRSKIDALDYLYGCFTVILLPPLVD